MTKAIPCVRRTIQALSFCFLLYLILQAAFPLESRIPVDLFLRLDPFIGIITVLTQWDFIPRMLPAFGVLLLVIIFGNFFCGWFCPWVQRSISSIGSSSGRRSGPKALTIGPSEGFDTGSFSFPLPLDSWPFR